jgi:hypothetical protein
VLACPLLAADQVAQRLLDPVKLPFDYFSATVLGSFDRLFLNPTVRFCLGSFFRF